MRDGHAYEAPKRDTRADPRPLGSRSPLLRPTLPLRGRVLPSSPAAMSSQNTSRIIRRRPSVDVVDAKVAVDLATAQTYSENVFLFVPNLIGPSSPPRPPLCLLTFYVARVFSGRSRGVCAALHELSSEILHRLVLYLLFTRRVRRTRGEGVGSGLQVRRSSGHGHGPVSAVVRLVKISPHIRHLKLYNIMLALLPHVRVSRIRARVPIPYHTRLQQSLYAHEQVRAPACPPVVRYIRALQLSRYGLPEPQAGRG